MEQLTPLNVTLCLLGMIMMILMKLQELKKKGEVISLGFWIKDNWINMGITLISAFASLIFADVIATALETNPAKDAVFYQFHAFISGFASQVMFGKLIKLVPRNEN